MGSSGDLKVGSSRAGHIFRAVKRTEDDMGTKPDPWEQVLGMGLGAIFTNQLVKWDAQLQVDLDKMLQKAKAANERRYFEQEDED